MFLFCLFRFDFTIFLGFCLSVCFFLIVAVAVYLFLSLLFILGFVCLFVFICFLPALFLSFSFLFFPYFVELCGLQGLGSQAWDRAWASGVGVLSPEHWNTREFPAPGNINQQELSWRSPSQLQDTAPPNCLQAPGLNTPLRTTSKTGTQTYPPADRLPKVILSPQTPQNTPPDEALPIRGKDGAPPTRTQAPVPSTRNPTQGTGPTSPTGGRYQKQEELWLCSLWKGDLKHSKLDKMRRQRNTLQMKKRGIKHKTK